MKFFKKMLFLLLFSVLALSGTELIFLNTAMAGEGVLRLKRVIKKPVSVPLRKAKAVTKTAPKKRGPHLFILPRDMSAAHLVGVLNSKGLKSASLDSCWRGDTAGVNDALMSSPAWLWSDCKDMDPQAEHAPVIWHSLVYRPEVVAARVLDKYTGAYKDHTLACRSAGSVERWDPYDCHKRHSPKMSDGELDDVGPDCVAPYYEFPEFRAGEAIWVTDE